jgi:hypothetical protein
VQERYLGDSHDYAKYALLRHLNAAMAGRLGINWYLTQPEQVDAVGNNDGEKRHHLGNRLWTGWEADIRDRLESFSLITERRITRIPEIGILPGDTLFVDDLVPVVGRATWHKNAQAKLHESSIVFLDPDNGFEVRSMSRKRAPKYAFYSEAIDYVRQGKTVVAIQFARQCDPVNKALTVRRHLMTTGGYQSAIPVIRARMAPNLLFIFLSPPSAVGELTFAIKEFARGREKIEIIE